MSTSQEFQNFAQTDGHIDAKILALKGQSNGLAPLDSNQVIPAKYIGATVSEGNGGEITPASFPKAGSSNWNYYPSVSGTYANFPDPSEPLFEDGIIVDKSLGRAVIIGNEVDGFKLSYDEISLAGYATTEDLSTKATNSEIRDTGANLVNPAGVEDGSIVSGSGEENSLANFHRSDFIFLASLVATFYSIRWVYPYDSAGTYIPSGFQAVSASNSEKVYTTVTFPEGTVKIRVVAHDDQLDKMMVVNGAENIPYEPYGYSNIKESALPLIPTEKIKNEAVTAEKTVFFNPSANLIDPSLPDQQVGIIKSGDGTVNTTNTSYITTGFIPVLGVMPYVIASGNFAGFYTESKTYIVEDFMPGSEFDGDGIASVISSATARFMRISATVARFPTVMLQLGYVFTGYVPFSAKTLKLALFPANIPVNINAYHRFYLSTVGIAGDSLMANGYFIPTIINALGWTEVNIAVGGEKSYQATKRIIDAIAGGAINVSLMNLFLYGVGTNDRTAGTILGDFDEVWDNTSPIGAGNSFTCALEEAIRQIYTVKKDISFVMITPQKRTDAGSGIWDDHGPLTSEGYLYTKDYRDRMIAVCEKWSVKVIDLFAIGQKNELNAVELTTSGDTVHMNFPPGYGLRVGNYLIRELNLVV